MVEIRDTRVIVVTYSVEFFNMLKDGFQPYYGIETVVQATSFLNIEARFIKSKTHVMILDVDNITFNPMHLKQLQGKYRLMVILTGSHKKVFPQLTKFDVKDYLEKPRDKIGFLANSYIRYVLQKIELFISQTPTLNFLDAQRTVDSNSKIVAIASSTGGPEALEKIFRALPADVPPILVVQHMPSGFTKLFADRLSNICPMDIREATNNTPLRKGLVLIAPADNHMVLARRNSKLYVDCYMGTKMHGVMPAADILFDSIAPIMRANVVGVVLTGMGADGARGLMKMHLAGAKTIGQDKETSVVYGMPKVAFELGAVDRQLPIDKIPAAIMELVR